MDTYTEQGRQYLQTAAPLAIDVLLATLDPTHAHLLAAAIADSLQAAQLQSREGPVQTMMLACVRAIQALANLPGRGYADTSQTGLPITPAGRRAKPDLAGYEGQPCASNVSIICEAKDDLAATTSDCEAAYQVVQRALQLHSQQPMRTKWVFASVGKASIRLFHISTAGEVRIDMFEPCWVQHFMTSAQAESGASLFTIHYAWQAPV